MLSSERPGDVRMSRTALATTVASVHGATLESVEFVSTK
jgi:hypothetical protein